MVDGGGVDDVTVLVWPEEIVGRFMDNVEDVAMVDNDDLVLFAEELDDDDEDDDVVDDGEHGDDDSDNVGDNCNEADNDVRRDFWIEDAAANVDTAATADNDDELWYVDVVAVAVVVVVDDNLFRILFLR